MTTFSFESSGKLKAPTPDELAAADESTAILAYTHGVMHDGRPYYAYVAVKPSKYREFHTATAARRTIVLGDYGEVVAGAFEIAPPPEVVAEMRVKYGYDEYFEEKLKQEVLDDQAEFLENKEENRIQDIIAMLKRQQADGGNA